MVQQYHTERQQNHCIGDEVALRECALLRDPAEGLHGVHGVGDRHRQRDRLQDARHVDARDDQPAQQELGYDHGRYELMNAPREKGIVRVRSSVPGRRDASLCAFRATFKL